MGRIHILRRIVTTRKTLKIPLYKGQYDVLRFVMDNPGCSQAYLAKNLMITPACVALSVKRLTKAQFLEKKIDKNNLRCNKLYCTPLALEAVNKCRDIMDEFDTVAFEGFTDKELADFTQLCEKMEKNIVNAYYEGKVPPKQEAMAIIKKIEEDEL